MRKTGKVVRWLDDKGFGFIAPASGGPEAFVHIHSLPRGPRPAVGATVTYREARDSQGRVRALEVRLAGDNAGLVHPAAQTAAALLALVTLAVLAGLGLLPSPLAWLALAASLASVLLYWRDKRAATRGGWRTPESRLHFWTLLGGWPGALWAQQRWRHKTSKREFRQVFWLTVALHIGATGYLMTPHGAPLAARVESAGAQLAAALAALPWQEWSRALTSG